MFHSNDPKKNHLSFVDFHSIYTNEEAVVKKIQMGFHSPKAPEFKLEGSCNGFLCLFYSMKNQPWICNPFSGKYETLPSIKKAPGEKVIFGFGYHPTTKEFKAVYFIYDTWERKQVDSKIMTLFSTSSWRELSTPYYFESHRRGTQVIVNGRLHWKALKNGDQFYNIISFDIKDENFNEVLKPDSLVLTARDYLVELRGCLAAVCVNSSEELDISIMSEYDVKESWIKELKIGRCVPRALKRDEASYGHILCALNNGKILLEYKSQALVLYDPESGNFRDVMFQGLPSRFHTFVHLGNLNENEIELINKVDTFVPF